MNPLPGPGFFLKKIQSEEPKRRLILPGAIPGEPYAVRQTENGQYGLERRDPLDTNVLIYAFDFNAPLLSRAFGLIC